MARVRIYVASAAWHVVSFLESCQRFSDSSDPQPSPSLLVYVVREYKMDAVKRTSAAQRESVSKAALMKYESILIDVAGRKRGKEEMVKINSCLWSKSSFVLWYHNGTRKQRFISDSVQRFAVHFRRRVDRVSVTSGKATNTWQVWIISIAVSYAQLIRAFFYLYTSAPLPSRIHKRVQEAVSHVFALPAGMGVGFSFICPTDKEIVNVLTGIYIIMTFESYSETQFLGIYVHQ